MPKPDDERNRLFHMEVSHTRTPTPSPPPPEISTKTNLSGEFPSVSLSYSCSLEKKDGVTGIKG